jgi:hypothetical protein
VSQVGFSTDNGTEWINVVGASWRFEDAVGGERETEAVLRLMKTKSPPQVTVWIDGHQVGWLSPSKSKRYAQVIRETAPETYRITVPAVIRRYGDSTQPSVEIPGPPD